MKRTLHAMPAGLLLFGSAAYAQEDNAAVAEGEPTETPTAAVRNDVIVVTAQRREETLEDVPLSITAISGDQLATRGIVNTQDLTLAVPGLNFERSTIAAQPTIRGIGTRSASTGNEGNVAIYMDGVYIAHPFASLFELVDVERVEVLKGPQGTLYGRNATGGAINIISRRPSFQTTGEFTGSVGSFDYYRGTAYISGPIVEDTIAASLSVIKSSDNGYIHNVFQDETTGERSLESFRGQLLFRPSSSAEIRLNALHSISNNTDNYAGHFLNGNTIVRTAPNPNNIPIDILIPEGFFETSVATDPLMEMKSTYVDLLGEFDLGFAQLNTTLSYHRSYGNSIRNADQSPLNLTFVQIRPLGKSYWAETLLSSQGDGPLSWVFGLNYFNDDTQTFPQFVNTSKSFYGIDTEAASTFAELTYQFGRLFVTGGLRYSWEEKNAFNQQVSTGVTTRGSDSWTAFTPRVAIRYEVTDDVNVYANYSKGFKSGTFDASGAAGAQASVDPEYVDAYEIGIKGALNRLRFSLAGFHYNYSDLQVVAINAGAGFSFSQLLNAAQSTVNGFEGTIDFRVSDHLRLSGSVAHLDAQFTEFPNAQVVVPRPFVNGQPVGNQTVFIDATGNQLIRAPKWTFTLGANYNTLVLGGEFDANVNLYSSSRYFYDFNNRVSQPAYTVVNASASWQPPGLEGLRISGNIYNLTDERYLAQAFISGTGDAVTYQRPRWWAVTVGYSF